MLGWATVIAVALIGCLAWVGVHATLSLSRMAEARSSAPSVIAAFSSDPASGTATAALRALKQRLDSAGSVIGDPLWMAAEGIPVAGENLRSYRLTVEGLSDAVGNGLIPVAPAIGRLSSALSLTSGSVDLGAVSAEAVTLSRATAALDTSLTTLAEASAGGVIEPLAAATTQAQTLVEELRGGVGGLATAARLLPSALGSDAPRRYGLLFANNAELRTTGGIAGALSELTADHGTVALGRQLTPTDLNPSEPFEPTPSERALFGTRTGAYVQDVDLTPDFARAAELAAAMWQRSQGEALDGIIRVDAVTLSGLLRETGPMSVGGVTLTADNATEQLLNAVYLRLPDPAAQDAFFADVTRAVYDKVLHGGSSTTAVLRALGVSAEQGRLSLWMAEPALRKELEGSALSGPLGRLAEAGSPVGVYFNDGTGAKMSYYLRGSIGAELVCRAGGRGAAGIRVTTRLTSTAPANSADGPWYLTGGGSFVPAGTVRTQLLLAGVPALQLDTVTVDGKPAEVATVAIAGHPIAAVTVDLLPGASATVVGSFATSAPRISLDRVIATPTATPLQLQVSPQSCG